MRAFRLLAASVVSLLFSVCCAQSALAAEPRFSPDSRFGPALVIASAQALLRGEQVADQRAADRADPTAVALRQASRTRYERLDPAQARGLAARAFPALFDASEGGPPRLPRGERITHFITTKAAEIQLPGGDRGVLESLEPMAVEPSPHKLVPIDLALAQAGGGFHPAKPAVEVQIPKRIGRGVRLDSTGVSLTPINAAGVALGGTEGVVDGAAVVYANSQTDTDTTVKPSTSGFAVDTILRSVASPRLLFFHVGLPQGARLVAKHSGIDVVDNGVAVAAIAPPLAQDAAGDPVPVAMKLVGANTVRLSVGGGEQPQYPIEVDPELAEVNEEHEVKTPTWEFSAPSGGFTYFNSYGGGLVIEPSGEYAPGQEGMIYYRTNGNSHIFAMSKAKIEFPTYYTNQLYLSGEAAIYVEFEGSGKLENRLVVAESGVPIPTPRIETFCPSTCAPSLGAEHNLVRLADVATGKAKDSARLNSATVSIAQPKETHSTMTYTSTPEIEYTSGGKVIKTKNAFYNGGQWVGPRSGAFQFETRDIGIGVSETRFEILNGKWEPVGQDPEETGNWPRNLDTNYLNTSRCLGIQCAEKETLTSTYSEWGSAATNGEHRVIVAARDAMNGTWSYEHGEGEEILKVDHSPPTNITVSGLPHNGTKFELGEVTAHLKVEATDGEAGIASSGVKSIALAVDGQEVGKPAGSCSVAVGPCTGTAEWSLNGSELGTGVHSVTVVATDNAGNYEMAGYQLVVYHASPVAMGPGSVNPQSGDFALEAADVAVSGGAGSLTLTRHYDSLNTHEGQDGPLGPEWSTSLGGLASLEVLPDKSVMVVGQEGLTLFSAKVENQKAVSYEAPEGDQNLTLEGKENAKNEVSEYLLKDPAKGTTTRFTLPSGTETWVATVSEGPVATDTVTDTYQTAESLNEYPISGSALGITSGPEGKLWFTNTSGGKIGTMTTAGAATEFSSLPSESRPTSIVTGQEGDLWFTEHGADKIVKMSASGSVLGEYSGGENNHPNQIVVGNEGNLWFTEEGAVGEMSPSGVLLKQFKVLMWGGEPTGIGVGPEGGIWFTDTPASSTTDFVGVIRNGARTEYQLPVKSSEPTSIAAGPEGNLWFTEAGTANIGEMTTAGTVLKEYAVGREGSETLKPRSIVEGPDKNLWFTEWNENHSKVGKITTSGVVSEYQLAASSRPEAITVGPDGNLWMAYDGSNTKLGVITTSGEIVEPRLELAPHASAACPAGEPEKWGSACRGLEFVYASSTKSNIGENESQWGEYKGRLAEVKFIAYEPSAKSIETKRVAQYSYDSLGRLRAEWNPEISPPLKTVYGYDSEGHLTALTPPGKESWAFTYGEIAGDSRTGRLLKVNEAPAGMELWKGQALANTELPKITGTADEGVRLAVSNGKWSATPVAYSYQWERCAAGAGCTPIGGAINPNYTVTAADLGSTILAIVSATNGGGSASAVAAQTQVVGTRATSPVEYSLPAGSSPYAVVTGPDNNLWFTAEGSGKVGKIGASGEGLAEYLVGETAKPEGITVGPDGQLWFADDGVAEVGHLTTSGTLTKVVVKGSLNQGIAKGPDGNLWLASGVSTGYVTKLNTKGETLAEYKTGPEPIAITTGPDNNLWAAMKWVLQRSKIAKITTEGAVSEYMTTASKSIGPTDIVTGPDGNLWFTVRNGNAIGKITTAGAITEYSLPEGCFPFGIVTGPDGNLWFTERSSNKIVRMTTSGSILNEYSLPAGSNPEGITVGPDGNIWYVDHGTNKIGKVVVEGEAVSPQPGSTIDYGVPLSGSGTPNMTQGEVAKWGQKDDPAYATAIFPRDEPQAWPATSYRRATIQYMDSKARTVNVASPSGAVSTSEYNEENELVRGLSPYDRVAALKEGCVSEKECKSAEVSKLLDTESKFNENGELIETWGPQHTVKLAAGKEKANESVLARNHAKYYYDEGAPPNEAYALVTKMEDGAETASKEEFDKRVTKTYYNGQEGFGWKLRKPTSTVTDAGGLNVTTTTVYDPNTGAVVETSTPGSTAWSYSSQFGNGAFSRGSGDTVDSHGNVWVTDDYAANIKEFSSSGALTATYGSNGSGSGQFYIPVDIAANATTGNVYVTDSGNARVQELNQKGEFLRAFGWGVSDGERRFEICTTVCRGGVPGGGAGQFSNVGWISVDSSGNVWLTDEGNSRVQEFNENGEFVLTFGWGVSDGQNKLEVCRSSCRSGIPGPGYGEFSYPTGIAVAGGQVYVADGENRVQEFTTEGVFVRQFGTGEGQLWQPRELAIDKAGNVYVADTKDNRVAEFSSTGSYIQQLGKLGTGNNEFKEPRGVAFDSNGAAYIVDTGNNRVAKWSGGTTGKPGTHSTKTVYYTAEAEAEVAACRSHPEWTGLPCQTRPVAQPEGGTPELPVTTVSYNMWDQPEKVEESFGAVNPVIRTKKTTFDSAGRPLVTEETAAQGVSLPKVTDEYSSTLGTVVKQSTTVGETTTSIKSVYNTLGQLTEYTDADGNTARYVYDEDGRVTEVSDGANGGKAKQAYHYDGTTGFMTELVDSGAGAFKAVYDTTGRITSESYPNAMTAGYTYNQSGEETGIEYTKTAHCATTCPEVWFSDSVTSSIHGETLSQASTLSEEPSYTYDALGRLTQVQEVPSGQGCKVRAYAYDGQGNRISQTSREPGSEGKCAMEGGTVESHTYDTANRLIDPGVTYDTFGDTTTLPAADAGGNTLTTEYYVDSQVFKQSQGGETIEYKLDPEERTRETISSGNSVSAVISHYDGDGSAVAWNSEEGGTKWTREIPGIGGSLTALQHSNGEVALQLHDLQGNIVATASDSETETKLLTKYNSTEFGVPNSHEAHPLYSWLGAAGVSSELPSGTVTQDGITYVPQTGQSLQSGSVPLPTPDSAVTPFSRPIEAWVGSQAGEGVSLALARAQQRQEERERANQLPAPIPVPAEGVQEEEILPPEEGCTGAMACSASRHPSLASQHCSIEAFIKLGALGSVSGSGLAFCPYKVAKMEVKVCIYIAGLNSGEGAALTCTHKFGLNTDQMDVPWVSKCESGRTYFTYAWGYIYGRNYYEGQVGYYRIAEGGKESSHSNRVCNNGAEVPPGYP